MDRGGCLHDDQEVFAVVMSEQDKIGLHDECGSLEADVAWQKNALWLLLNSILKSKGLH